MRVALLATGIGATVLWTIFAQWVPLLPNLYVPLLDLGKITGYTWPSALRYLALVLALYGLYATGYVLVRRGAGGPLLVGLLSVLFILPLMWTYPATAVDVFGYAAHGRLLAVHGLNPFIARPSFVADPINPYLAFPDEPSQYGPLWVILGAALASLAQGDLLREILLYKLVGAVAHLIGGGLVFASATKLGAPRPVALASACLYLWNPLLLWEMVGNAHNDGVMVLGLLVAIWALAAGHERFVLPAVAAGALVKVPIAVVSPILFVYLLRRRPRAAIEGTLLALALLVIAYRPFWEGLDTLTPLRRTELFTASMAAVVLVALQPVFGRPPAVEIARTLALALFGAAFLVLLWQSIGARTAREAIRLCYTALLAALLLAITWFQAWYVVWPMAAGATLGDARRHAVVALLSLGAMLSYFVFIYLWVMGVLPDGVPIVQFTAYLVIVGPFIVGWSLVAERASESRAA